ncbi:MAG: ester cyclase [Pseudomonadota bacterium]
MTKLRHLSAALSLLVAFAATSAAADEKATVQTFYDLLSNPGSKDHTAAFMAVTSEGWESIGNYTGSNKTRDAFVGQVSGFGKLIPDLNWAVQAMHRAGDVVTVRSRATGTPKGPLFGIDGQGRSFDIMTIDIHELEDGKIVRSFHVEDWAGALQQLAGN